MRKATTAEIVDQPAIRQAIIDLADDIVVTLDESGRVTSFNAAAERAFGHRSDEAADLNVRALFPSLSTPLSESDPRCRRVDARHRDGTDFAAEIRQQRIAQSRGDGFVLLVRTLTGQEQRLRESEERLKAIIDYTSAVIYLKDVKGRYILVNRRFEQLFSVTNEMLRGKTDHSVFPKLVADAFRRNDLEVLKARAEREFDEIAPHEDGPHDYISVKFPLFRPDGEMYGVCGISTDITRRKRAEAALAATKEQLEQLVEARTADLRDTNARLEAEIVERERAARDLTRLIETASEGIWTLDTAGNTTFVNHGMAEMLGYTVDEMIGRSLLDFTNDRWRPEAEESFRRSQQGVEAKLDFEFELKDGTPMWAILATSPIRDENDKVVGAFAMITDITARKRAEERQDLLMRELDHRVKNVLATVIGLADATAERALSFTEYRQSFAARVHVLARTHEALAKAQWQDLALDSVVRLVLAPHRAASEGRVSAKGASVRVTAGAMTPLALTLNELGTNALKYGALSARAGCVSLRWGHAADGVLDLEWRESGGPPVSAPARDGTGLSLIRRLVEYELDGTIVMTFPADGVRCRLTIPALV
ncbi:MAG: PAS domain S-box protein [Myxococcales bacterium]|nr:MAG: PAS domain S-box protein [Myxococcales bacterium]